MNKKIADVLRYGIAPIIIFLFIFWLISRPSSIIEFLKEIIFIIAAYIFAIWILDTHSRKELIIKMIVTVAIILIWSLSSSLKSGYPPF